jgi:hypothetical protein
MNISYAFRCSTEEKSNHTISINLQQLVLHISRIQKGTNIRPMQAARISTPSKIRHIVQPINLAFMHISSVVCTRSLLSFDWPNCVSQNLRAFPRISRTDVVWRRIVADATRRRLWRCNEITCSYYAIIKDSSHLDIPRVRWVNLIVVEIGKTPPLYIRSEICIAVYYFNSTMWHMFHHKSQQVAHLCFAYSELRRREDTKHLPECGSRLKLFFGLLPV